MKTLVSLISLGALTLGLVACGPTAPQATNSAGKPVAGDKGISGAVTGEAVGAKTKVAVFGAFVNLPSNNKIDTDNQTITADTTLAVAPVSAGKYNFAMPKAPQKAHLASFKVFAFNDDNDNSKYDENEKKSKEATITWSLAGGYQAATDADGSAVISLLDPFKDFNFKLD